MTSEDAHTLHNQPLTYTPSHKYLGITLSSNLEFDRHIHNITNRANRTLGFLRRNLHNCTPDIKHVVYNTLVRPTLEYCSALWDPYTIDNRYKLEQINIRAAMQVHYTQLGYTQTPGITFQIKIKEIWICSSHADKYTDSKACTNHRTS